jgi:hypothetical protein
MRHDLNTSTLCFPDGLKSCFACCPPIRPAGYEHATYKNIIRRILRENTASFVREDRATISIRGFSCWALGYLDRDCRLPGCLLHPFQNDGIDLRYRVDYGEKCQRESCQEARTFAKLPSDVKAAWIHLADGLDSFSYSSRSTNLLFRMMNWGEPLLHLIPAMGGEERLTGEAFLKTYPFFTTSLSPKGHAYLLCRLINEKNFHWLKSIAFKDGFERLSLDLLGNFARSLTSTPSSSLVHLLPLDRNFTDFVRLFLGITRMTNEEALDLKCRIDAEVEKRRRTLARELWKTN